MKTKINIMMCVLLPLSASVAFAGEQWERPHLNDTEIRQMIVGTWIVDLKSPSGKSMGGSVSILNNGTCSANAVILRGERKTEFSYECAWEVKDGFLIETVNKTNNSKLIPLGKVTRDYVIRLDEKQFVYRSENGKIAARSRIKNNDSIQGQ